ncbi:MAG: phospholipase D-like domain-containing protein [Armatimonadetes bacterium]|nr:phospholipase D-like domain-containing protein [Armatimonadota bacterium]
MSLRVIDNQTQPAGEALRTAIRHASDVRIAVAFVSKEGVSILLDALRRAADRGACLEFIIGLDGQATEPEALSALWGLTEDCETASLWCWEALGPRATFHPKLYIVRRGRQATCLIGSSNLTRGGLADNIEVNVFCRGSDDDEIVSQAYRTYLRIKRDGAARRLDAELLGRYEELWHAAEQARKYQRASRLYGNAERRLRKAMSQKPRIALERADLYGWLDMVYDVLPEGEFTNQDVYQHRDLFRHRFPRNLNIGAKIRQKLQELRDLGFIEHLGPGLWRKL